MNANNLALIDRPDFKIVILIFIILKFSVLIFKDLNKTAKVPNRIKPKNNSNFEVLFQILRLFLTEKKKNKVETLHT